VSLAAAGCAFCNPLINTLSAAYPQPSSDAFMLVVLVLAAHKTTVCSVAGLLELGPGGVAETARLRRRQAVMARTLGISPAHRR
jgi:hypothetical protein